jgi:asparagine synthase (glutamine-hydrolysing)
MCGIFGFVERGAGGGLGPEQAQVCLQAMSHRGPDASAMEAFSSSQASGVLGHLRLSIIDLSGGAQPMHSADGQLLLSFNGEIYNYLGLKQELIGKGHEFLDHSDTEVLLHAYQEWGEACVRRLRGMFAFAIWDARSESLFIARDHFGKKPLFHMQCGDTLYFASEIKALQRVPHAPFHFNAAQLRNYVVYRYVPSPETFISEIKKLPAGTFLVWQGGRIRTEKYFSPPEAAPAQAAMTPERATRRFWELLDESVRLRMAADVPFGAFLSGGIDSSAVVALMSDHSSQKVKTFSIGFAESEYSELGHAGVIAEQFKTDHHEFTVSQDDLMEFLPEVVRYRDAPVCEPSDIPIYLLARHARKTVKMVLTGEGSDEILGGYPKHSFERLVSPFQRVPGLVRNGAIGPLVDALPYRFRRAKTAIRNLNRERFDERMPGWFGALDAGQADALIRTPGQAPLPELVRSKGRGNLHDILLFDQLSWLPDNLLERGDRMTMAASLEARMPFMDVELAAFAASLPDHYRIRGLTTKWILRQAMKSVLPREILERPKVGFRVPVNLWFRTSMKDYLVDHLLGPESISKDFFHPPVLRALVFDHTEGRQNNEKVLWMLLNLEIWLRQNEHKVLVRP